MSAAPAKAKGTKVKAKVKRWLFTAEHLRAYGADDPCRPFAEHVAANPDQHNRWVHLACRRHALDLTFSKSSAYPYVFDAARGRRPAAFAAQFLGLEGPLAGKPLVFLDWQNFITGSLYGWRMRADTRKRRFQYAHTEVPRKNGKTGFAAPVGIYQLAYPPPKARCDVYSAATKKDQAKIVWRDAGRLLKTAPEWASIFRRRVDTLTHVPSESIWTPVGSDSDTLDGLRPELVIMDETHKWPTRGLWDVFNDAFGAAFSPLIFQITTAGEDVNGICYEQRSRVTRILEAVERGTYKGEVDDQGFYFGIIFTIDPDDAWDDPASWIKANPSLGIVKSMAEMEKLVVGARLSPGARRTFLVKQLNVWQTTGPARWLDPAQWWRGHPGEPLNFAECWERFAGLRVWGGMDLASTTDSSSWALIAEDPTDPANIIAAWSFFLPADDLADRCARDDQPYDLWAREGWLNLTPGNISDVNYIKRDITGRLKSLECEVVAFAYDPGWAQGVGQQLQDEEGLPMLICPQRYATMTVPLDEFERRVLTAQLRHGGNPLAAAQAAAASIITGRLGGKLLAKGQSNGRIDGMSALAMAFAARQNSMENPSETAGVMYV